MSPVASLGAPRLSRTAFYWAPAAPVFKDTGIMEESTNNRQHGDARLWPPLNLRASTHLMTQNSQGKLILFVFLLLLYCYYPFKWQ